MTRGLELEYFLTPYVYMTPYLTPSEFNPNATFIVKEGSWNVGEPVVSQVVLAGQKKVKYYESYRTRIDHLSNREFFEKRNVQYLDDKTQNKMKNEDEIKNAIVNTLSTLAAYDVLSIRGELRGFMDLNRAPPENFTDQVVNSVDILSSALSVVGILVSALMSVFGESKTKIQSWDTTTPVTGYICPPTGYSSDVDKDNYDKGTGNPMRLFAPSIFMREFGVRIGEDFVYIFPRYNHLRWLVSVNCVANGRSYFKTGDTIYIKHYGGAASCTISSVAITYDKIEYYRRKSSLWRTVHAPGIKYLRAGEMAFSIARKSQYAEAKRVCDYTSTFQHAKAHTELMDPDSTFHGGFTPPNGIILATPEDAHRRVAVGPEASKTFFPENGGGTWWD